MIHKISFVLALGVLLFPMSVRAQDEGSEKTIRDSAAQAKESAYRYNTVFSADAALADAGCGLNPERVDALRRAVETAAGYSWWTVIETARPAAGTGCAADRLYVHMLPDDFSRVRRVLERLPFLSGQSQSSDEGYSSVLTRALAQSRVRIVGDHGRFHVVEASRLPVPIEQLKGKTWQCAEPRTGSDMDGSYEYVVRTDFRLEEGARVSPASNDPSWTKYYEASGTRIYFYSIHEKGAFHDYNVDWIEIDAASPEALSGPHGFKCSARAVSTGAL